MIDWTVSLSALIQVAIMSGTLAAIYYGFRNEIRILHLDVRHVEEQVKHLGHALEQLGSILIQIAVQDTRLCTIEKAVDELRHGQGFIKNRAKD